jgi:hypothetical protein
MAKDTAKKNIKSNQVRLRNFLIITVAVNLLWLLQPLVLASNDDPNSSWTIFSILSGLSFWAGQEYFTLRQLHNAGQPTYDENGNLQDCIDLSDPDQLGILSYAQDILWSCWALQLLTQFVSPKFWYLYLAIPVFAVYKLWTGFLQPMLNLARGQQQQQDPTGGAAGGNIDESNLPQDPKSRLDRKRQELRGKAIQRNK